MGNTSKYKRLYGMGIVALSEKLNKPIAEIVLMHKYGLLKKIKNPLPERLDKRMVERYNGAKTRCSLYGKGKGNSRNKKYYVGKGVKFLLSYEDIYFLWKRDKAEKMNAPSLDRKITSGNYERKNCRFIEWADNRNWQRRTK